MEIHGDCDCPDCREMERGFAFRKIYDRLGMPQGLPSYLRVKNRWELAGCPMPAEIFIVTLSNNRERLN